MNTHARKLLPILLVSVFALSLSACNTMKGLGEDTEVAGEKIQKEADSHIDDKDESDDRRNRL
jgi:predicted small secreted protein